MTVAAVALVAAGFAIRHPQVVSAGVVAGAIVIAIGLIRRGGLDVTGAVEGTALFVAAELAWWSLEAWIPVKAEPGTDRPRWLTLSALTLAGLGLGSAATALVAGGVLGRTGTGGALLETLGAAGAVVVVALVVAVAGSGNRPLTTARHAPTATDSTASTASD